MSFCYWKQNKCVTPKTKKGILDPSGEGPQKGDSKRLWRGTKNGRMAENYIFVLEHNQTNTSEYQVSWQFLRNKKVVTLCCIFYFVCTQLTPKTVDFYFFQEKKKSSKVVNVFFLWKTHTNDLSRTLTTNFFFFCKMEKRKKKFA